MGAEVSTGALKNPPAKEEDYSDDMSDFLCCLCESPSDENPLNYRFTIP